MAACSAAHSYNTFPVAVIHDRSREHMQWKHTSLCFITCQVLLTQGLGTFLNFILGYSHFILADSYVEN